MTDNKVTVLVIQASTLVWLQGLENCYDMNVSTFEGFS